jgi:hypothetical protein
MGAQAAIAAVRAAAVIVVRSHLKSRMETVSS